MREEITNALHKLGERSHNVDIKSRGGNAVVYVNKEYYGVYDFTRKTFVD